MGSGAVAESIRVVLCDSLVRTDVFWPKLGKFTLVTVHEGLQQLSRQILKAGVAIDDQNSKPGLLISQTKQF